MHVADAGAARDRDDAALFFRPSRNIAPGSRSAGVTATGVGAPSRVRRIMSATGVPTLPRKEPTGRNGWPSADTISSPSRRPA